jgi:regulator of nucleoside diphosphate kinase
MKPQIIVSSLDADRLEALLDTSAINAAAKVALLEELCRAQMVEPQDMPPAVVTMNSQVRFTISPPGEEFCLTLSYPKDMQTVTDGISILTPIGTALLGLAVGDAIAWPRPDGQLLNVRVLEVLYQPEQAGEYFR